MTVALSQTGPVGRRGDAAGAFNLRGLLALMLSMLLIGIFMFYLGPKGEQTRVLQPMARFIDDRDIQANMYFYTEVEEFYEADVNMNNTMKYPPHGP